MLSYNYVPIFHSTYYNLKPYIHFLKNHTCIFGFICLTSLSPTEWKPVEGWDWSVLAQHCIPNAQHGTQHNPLTENALNGWREGGRQMDLFSWYHTILHSRMAYLNAIVELTKSCALLSNLGVKMKMTISK